MRYWMTVLFILSLGIVSADAHADEIRFLNGDLLKGVLLRESPGEIIFESANLGVLTVQREMIKTVIIAGPEPEEEIKTPSPGIEWVREIEGSYQLKSGNTDAEELAGKFLVNRKREKVDEWTFRGRGYYSSEDKKMNSQRYYGLARYAWSFGREKKWYHFMKTEADHDRFANIDARYTPATGAGYWFSDRKEFKAVIDGGPGVEWTRYRDDKPDSTELIFASRIYLECLLFDRLTLSEEFLFYPALSDFGNYRFHSETWLKMPVHAGLSLKFGLVNDYQSDPGPTAEKNDLRLETALAWSF